MLRRVLTIALLMALGLPLAAPLLAASTDSDSRLPACCRRHGKHHCNMGSSFASSSVPVFQAPPCPFYPTVATQGPATAAALAVHPQASVSIGEDAATAFSCEGTAQIFVTSMHLTRGPPVRLG